MRELLARFVEKFLQRDQVSWLAKQGFIVGRNFVMLDVVFIDPSHMSFLSAERQRCIHRLVSARSTQFEEISPNQESLR